MRTFFCHLPLLLLALAGCSSTAPKPHEPPPAEAAPSGPRDLVPPVALGYVERIQFAVRRNIAFPVERVNGPQLRSNPAAEVEARVAPSGHIIGIRLVKSSGVREWDAAVLRAVQLTGVMPRDTDGSVPPTMLLVVRPR